MTVVHPGPKPVFRAVSMLMQKNNRFCLVTLSVGKSLVQVLVLVNRTAANNASKTTSLSNRSFDQGWRALSYQANPPGACLLSGQTHIGGSAESRSREDPCREYRTRKN